MSSIVIICALAVSAAEETCPIHFMVGKSGKVRIAAELSRQQTEALPSGLLPQESGETVLRLQLKNDDGTLGPNIFSSYLRENGSLILTPRFGLVPGQTYVATFLTAGKTTATRLHRVPVAYRRPAPVVKNVFPTGSRLPANHLKFYIHFSQPMREGREIFEKIRLVDANGKRVGDPWRRRELWNSDATRLTLWIHPGRIKTGVNLRNDEGPVLLPAKTYTLLIDSDLYGADGQRLRAYKKSFSTTGFDRKRPLPIEWKIDRIRSSTRDRLRVHFGETLDAALAKRCLRIYGPDGKLVTGEITLQAKETSWSFLPAKPWLNGGYRLIVDPDLEDLAGNTPRRVFDTDLRNSELDPAVLDLGFRPRPRQ